MAPNNKPKIDDSAPTVIKDVGEFMVASLSRLDEKVNNTLEKQDELQKRFEKLFDHYNNLLERVVNVESKNVGEIKKNLDELLLKFALVEKVIDNIAKEHSRNSETIKTIQTENDELTDFKKGTEAKFRIVFDLILKVGTGLLLAYIAYKLGIQP
jgi:hypothetical protein